MKFVWLAVLTLLVSSVEADQPNTVRIAKGIYKPLFKDKGEVDRPVGPLIFDRFPVTNSDFLAFLKAKPQWQRSKVKKIFADQKYLQHWTGDLSFEQGISKFPVTNVSWFLARRYCQWKGGRLPRMDEWEYASDASEKKNLDMILAWYAKPTLGLQKVGQNPPNRFGLNDMHGLIWEWVDDFASVIIQGDSRDENDTDKNLFCGAGALKAKNPNEYATFMRFAFRSSLKAQYTTLNLGFRCVYDER